MIHQRPENGSHSLEDQQKDKTAKVMDQTQGLFHTAENIATKVANGSSDVAKRYPLQSLAIAAGCGFLLGRLFSHRI